ncbi:MAG: hypothetical protein IKS51_08960 [Erysipelotrichaceae bacterium]|nr:hypothetical protein [Erysipelotrichaceae bacterium]
MSIALLIILVFAVLGFLFGIVLAKNGHVGYGVANLFGKQHMKKLGIEDNDDTNDRWDA